MDKENMEYIQNGTLFNHKVEGNYIICMKMNGIIDHHIKWNKPDWETQISQVVSHMQSVVFKYE
jgi:hypothetical protein